jgi:hypothetical protein
MDAFAQMLPGLAEAAEVPPELALPQAARLVPMAAATAAIMMRRMETVLPAGGAPIAPGDRRREAYRFGHVYPTAGPGSPAKRR